MEHPENDEAYVGLTVNDGVAQPSIVNPYLKRQRVKRRQLSADEMVAGILQGDVTILSQAVTLVEHARPDVTLTTGIGELSSLVMGAYPLQQAAALGRISVSDASFIPDIQRAIGWDKKPVNITYF